MVIYINITPTSQSRYDHTITLQSFLCSLVIPILAFPFLPRTSMIWFHHCQLVCIFQKFAWIKSYRIHSFLCFYIYLFICSVLYYLSSPPSFRTNIFCFSIFYNSTLSSSSFFFFFFLISCQFGFCYFSGCFALIICIFNI